MTSKCCVFTHHVYMCTRHPGVYNVHVYASPCLMHYCVVISLLVKMLLISCIAETTDMILTFIYLNLSIFDSLDGNISMLYWEFLRIRHTNELSTERLFAYNTESTETDSFRYKMTSMKISTSIFRVNNLCKISFNKTGASYSQESTVYSLAMSLKPYALSCRNNLLIVITKLYLNVACFIRERKKKRFRNQIYFKCIQSNSLYPKTEF
jgi:hypothetical protein